MKKVDRKIDAIKKTVCDVVGIDINRNTRKREYTYGRFLFFQLCRDKTPATVENIGKAVRKNHATVIHGLKVFEDVMWGLDYWRNAYLTCVDVIDEIGEDPLEHSMTIDRMKRTIDELQVLLEISEQKIKSLEARKPLKKDYVEVIDLFEKLSPQNKREWLIKGITTFKLQPKKIYNLDVELTPL